MAHLDQRQYWNGSTSLVRPSLALQPLNYIEARNSRQSFTGNAKYPAWQVTGEIHARMRSAVAKSTCNAIPAYWCA
jgi:hypothetical protein